MRSWKGCEPRETVSAQARKTGPAGKGGRFFIGRSYEREMVAEPVGRARAASGPVAGGAHRGLDGSEEEGVTLRGKGSAAWAALLFLRPFRGTKKARAGRASAPDEAEDEAEAEEDGEAAGAGGFAFAFGGLRVSGRWISALRMVRALGFGLCGGGLCFRFGVFLHEEAAAPGTALPLPAHAVAAAGAFGHMAAHRLVEAGLPREARAGDAEGGARFSVRADIDGRAAPADGDTGDAFFDRLMRTPGRILMDLRKRKPMALSFLKAVRFRIKRWRRPRQRE